MYYSLKFSGGVGAANKSLSVVCGIASSETIASLEGISSRSKKGCACD